VYLDEGSDLRYAVLTVHALHDDGLLHLNQGNALGSSYEQLTHVMQPSRGFQGLSSMPMGTR
jgi:hypothetical protein